MKEFFRGLGKKVQELWNRIFGKKEQEPQNSDVISWTNTDIKLGAGEVFLDGVSIGKVESITSINRNDISDETWESLISIFGDGEINCGLVKIPSDMELPKNFFNIPYPLLPKRYWCKTLILSLAANQPYDYQAVDMSQYEERKLAHFIIGRMCSLQELKEEYLADLPDYNYSEAEIQEERAYLDEAMREAEDTGLFSVPIPNATLLHYEDEGIWSFETEDEDEDE